MTINQSTASSISSRTAAVYQSHIRSLITKIHEDTAGDQESRCEVTHRALVEKFLATAGDVSPNTRQIRKSALANFLCSESLSGKITDAEYISLKEALNSVECKTEGKKTAKNTRDAGRSIPEQDYRIMLAWLESRFNSKKSSAIARLTYHYIIASCACGARPTEWATAEWADTNRKFLRLYTAKAQKRAAWNQIPAGTFTHEEIGQTDKITISPDFEDIASFNLTGVMSLAQADFENKLSSLTLNAEELNILRQSRIGNGLDVFRDIPIDDGARESVQFMLDAVSADLHRPDRSYIDPSERDALQNRWLTGGYNRIRVQFGHMSANAFSDRLGVLYSPADCRSTFAANTKARLGRRVAATLLGHTGLDVSKRHYAPASRAWAIHRGEQPPKEPRRQGDSLAKKIVERARIDSMPA